MGTSVLLLCVILAGEVNRREQEGYFINKIVGGVPITKGGSGWEDDQKEPKESPEDDLADDLSHGLLSHRIADDDKNSIDYDEMQDSFTSSFSFMFGSIEEASFSEYYGFANDRNPESSHDATTLVSHTSSRQPEVGTVQRSGAGRTSGSGSKSKDGSQRRDEITTESQRRGPNTLDEHDLQLNEVGYGLIISFGALLIAILLVILVGTLIQMVKKFRA